MINRRHFLRSSCALGAAAGFATNLAGFNAFAADGSDYKALVCIFLLGGHDSHDLIIPYDQTSYDEYEVIREALLTGLDDSEFGQPRRRENLLELTGSGINNGGRSFGLPEEMRPLHELYAAGDMAVIGNVGPLIEPTTRTTFQSGAAVLPPKLFSHSDQQATWHATYPNGGSTGWGGRFSDIMHAAGSNGTSAFTSVSTAGITRFLTGNSAQPFQISSRGSINLSNIASNSVLGSSDFSSLYAQTVRGTGLTSSSLFGTDVVDVMNKSLENNAAVEAAFNLPGDPTTSFPGGRLSDQLNVVARMIARRGTFGVRRQVFFVGIGGFDTHDSQQERLPVLQAEIASSMRAFRDAMVELGVNDNVTAFTASDFGRTLSLNSTGSDHGWGGHHMVVGGAVNGGQVLGNIPPPAFNHESDTGRGRLIPNLSVDQYAAALGRWFGLSQNETLEVLPGLANFDQTALNGLFT